MAVIAFHDVRKSFGRVRALDGLSCSVTQGEIVGLLGPNGAGKTTAIHIILGLVTPDAGTIQVFGRSPIRHRAEVMRRLNFASAYTTLPSNLTVLENLRIFARLYDIVDIRRKLTKLIELFELGDFRHTPTGRLSSGEQMRVSLAKSFLNDPELLLLDEPTLSLDPHRAEETRKFLLRLHAERGITLLYTSHNMQEVETMCQRALFIHHGRLIAQGTPEAIKRQFQSASLHDVFMRVATSGELVTMNGS